MRERKAKSTTSLLLCIHIKIDFSRSHYFLWDLKKREYCSSFFYFNRTYKYILCMHVRLGSTPLYILHMIYKHPNTWSIWISPVGLSLRYGLG
jgi:hypothetical protein